MVNEKHTEQQRLGSVLAGVIKIGISESQIVFDLCDSSTRQRVENKEEDMILPEAYRLSDIHT